MNNGLDTNAAPSTSITPPTTTATTAATAVVSPPAAAEPAPIATSSPKPAAESERAAARLRFWAAVVGLIAALLTVPWWAGRQPAAPPAPVPPVRIAIALTNEGGSAASNLAVPVPKPTAVVVAEPRPSPARAATPITSDEWGSPSCATTQDVLSMLYEARDAYGRHEWQRALDGFRCAHSKLPDDVKRTIDERAVSAAFRRRNVTLTDYSRLALEVQQLLEPARAALEER